MDHEDSLFMEGEEDLGYFSGSASSRTARVVLSAQQRYNQLCVPLSHIQHRLCYECGDYVPSPEYAAHTMRHEAVYLAYQLFYFEREQNEKVEKFKAEQREQRRREEGLSPIPTTPVLNGQYGQQNILQQHQQRPEDEAIAGGSSTSISKDSFVSLLLTTPSTTRKRGNATQMDQQMQENNVEPAQPAISDLDSIVLERGQIELHTPLKRTNSRNQKRQCYTMTPSLNSRQKGCLKGDEPVEEPALSISELTRQVLSKLPSADSIRTPKRGKVERMKLKDEFKRRVCEIVECEIPLPSIDDLVTDLRREHKDRKRKHNTAEEEEIEGNENTNAKRQRFSSFNSSPITDVDLYLLD